MGWIVTQVGAREHYAVARGLARRGRLDRMYTDVWAGAAARLLQRAPGPIGRLGGRYSAELDGRVRGFEARMTLGHLADRAARTAARTTAHELRCIDDARRFSALVRDDLTRHADLRPTTHACFGYSTATLETALHLRERGIPTVLGQAGCGRTDFTEVAVERAAWPDWEGPPSVLYDEYFARAHAEWAASSAVVVNSRWSRDAAVREGCPPEKLFTIPLAFEPAPASTLIPAPDRDGSRGPGERLARRLRVIWLGQVNLRKGIPYLMEAARQLPDVDVILAGQLRVDGEVLRRAAPPNVRILGHVPRPAVQQLLATADVFVLPTLSDGFALTQVEAMAAGLPVIATNRCGEVVTDGVDGYLVPARDAAALADRIGRLEADRGRLAEFSRAARANAARFSLDVYTEGLAAVIRRVAPNSALGQPVPQAPPEAPPEAPPGRVRLGRPLVTDPSDDLTNDFSRTR